MGPGADWRALRVLKRSLIALLLSFISPGLGQVYNGQMLRGVLFYASVPIFLEFSLVLGLLQSYRGFIAHVAIGILLFVLIIIDAVWTAGRQANTTLPRRGWKAYVLAAGMLFVTGTAFAGNVFPNRLPGVRAYKITGGSMVPTLMKGDGIIVDMRCYSRNGPTRGDVVAIALPPNGTLAIKRVVAVGGDVIKANPQATMVNGQTIREPYLGTVSDDQRAGAEAPLTFGPLTVPANQVFVMGDNRSHSFDSRYFGPLGINQVRGKVLYIYSSADRSRIGQAMR
jgi:signal peptidase I